MKITPNQRLQLMALLTIARKECQMAKKFHDAFCSLIKQETNDFFWDACWLDEDVVETVDKVLSLNKIKVEK